MDIAPQFRPVGVVAVCSEQILLQLFLAWCVSVLRPVPMQPCLGAYASAALKKQAACCRCFSRWHGRCYSSSGLASLPYPLVFALFFDTNSTPRADVVARRSSSVQTSQSLTVHRRWTRCGRTSPCRRTRCRSRLLGQRRAHCMHCDELQERMFGIQAARAPRHWGLAVAGHRRWDSCGAAFPQTNGRALRADIGRRVFVGCECVVLLGGT